MLDKPKKASGKGKRTKLCDIYNDPEDQYMCMERAATVLETLDEGLPKFGKCMLPSNVLYSFWLILPSKFCVNHLPEHDTTVILVDESGKEFKTNYLKVRHGLSAGWRGFTVAQRLLQGDILFFRLIEPCKLQVNIVRRYDLEAIEAADCLMEMHPRAKKVRVSNYFDSDKAGEPKKERRKCKKAKEEIEDELKHQTPIPVKMTKGKRTKRSPKKFIARLSLDFCSNQGVTNEEDGERVSCVDQCGNSSDGLGSEVLQGSTSEMTNQSQAEEDGCYKLNLGCHESTAERIFHSPTVTT
ncbi:B3 DNA binding domain-containing protein [Artemisia annua]|uniref:B3 DNA binding domain-containing protein n=1 Tax=Artemisia annua TaxID=35608 RepID=A0A2U1LY88_ARTAN|nr:B3 DNA binding domain-containing protein [Artemisia annua]